MTDAGNADEAAGRVEAFLPEFFDIPDDPIAAQRGAAMFASDVRVVVTDRARLLAEVDRLRRELADVAPYVEAGKQAVLERAKHEYEHGSCDDCSCCTTAQCAERRCPTDSLGDSICPCTCF